MSTNKKQPVSRPTATKSVPATSTGKTESSFDFAFGTINYILLAIGILLLGVGYLMLSGGGSDDPNVFNPAMFDKRRLVIAPILIVLGLVVEICAIMFRSSEDKKDDNSESTEE